MSGKEVDGGSRIDWIPDDTNECHEAVPRRAILGFLLAWGWTISTVAQGAAAQVEIHANPSNYLALLRALRPGDTLVLEPGTYDDPQDVPGLPFFGMNGTGDLPIIVTGPDEGPRPIFLGRSTHNTVRFDNASHIVLRNVEIDGRNLGGDGINGQGASHDITIENISIRGVGGDQLVVGISTKAPAWNWVIRRCVIERAGTGIYLGNSDGTQSFVGGMIENNLIVDTMGYNMEIKHQISRSGISGMPTGDMTTVIRHNVFSKANNASMGGMARPNLLVGHFPLSGPGSKDVYQIYGNFFYRNPTGEPLFQGEGNIALHHNIFFNDVGNAIWIQPHNDVPKMVQVFNNTVLAIGSGIEVRGGDPAYRQSVIGNAVFAATPITAMDKSGNVTDAFSAAANYLVNPSGALGALDLFPKVGKLAASQIEVSGLQAFLDWEKDFNGYGTTGIFRGAYSGEGQNPGWLPKLERKPLVAPSPPTGLRLEPQ